MNSDQTNGKTPYVRLGIALHAATNNKKPKPAQPQPVVSKYNNYDTYGPLLGVGGGNGAYIGKEGVQYGS